MDRIHVLYPEKIGVISKDIYGFFVETIESLLAGIYVGEDSDIPNIRGIRKELIEKLRAIKAPLFRWGGCTNEVYDWRYGIGPKEKRPVTLGLAYAMTNRPQRNDFGTHEFIDLCKLSGADSYITLNIASVQPMDAYRWMEYCNIPRGTTTMALLREENGSPEPFNVKYFGVGNENNEHGGLMSPEDYSAAYSRVSSVSYAALRDTNLIASGPTWAEANIDWTRRFLANYDRRGKFSPWHSQKTSYAMEWVGRKMDAFSIHHYAYDNAANGNGAVFTEEQWYEALARAMKIEKMIEDYASIVREFQPTPTTGISIDEWGLWTTLKGGGPWTEKPMLGQVGTMREAMVAAMSLSVFNNHCDVVKLACLTALTNYLHNLFETRGAEMFATPTYYVFDMMKEHQNAECLRTVCAAETKNGVQRVYTSASVKDGKTLITLVNTDYSNENEVVVELHNASFPGEAELTLLAADDPHEHNSFENPENVVPVKSTIKAEGGELKIKMPKASIMCLSF